MTIRRAYAKVEWKAATEGDQRILIGTASTPTPDRADDVVEPEGAVYKLPLPLLWQHRSDSPIGWVTEAKVTKAGIRVVCKVAEGVAGYIEEAWNLIKAGLVPGFSIGFVPHESADIDGSWGRRFLKWEWLELSTVTIPMNAEASIQTIKSIDQAVLAKRPPVVRLSSVPGDSGPSNTHTEGTQMKTLKEQIAAFEAKRAATVGAAKALMDAAAEKGETLNKEDGEAYDAHQNEVKSIDKHLARLREQEALEVAAGTVVDDNAGSDADLAAQQRSAGSAGGTQSGGNVVLVRDNLPKGMEFARYAKCLAAARGNRSEALEIAKSVYPTMKRIHVALKAAVAAGTTTDATWAGALQDYVHFANDFIEYLRPQTILGKFGQDGIPDLFRVPFNIQVPAQTSAGAAYWVGEGKPKPLTKFDFTNITMRWAKVANIAVLTDELVRFSNPSADTLVRNALAEAIIERLDRDFIDPSKAAVADVSPASITNGVTPVTPSGTDADALRTDVAALIAPFIAANLPLTSGVFIMSANTALTLSLMRNALGQREFPDLTINGGRLEGLPVIVSNYVPYSVSGGGVIILLNARDIYLSDDGVVTIDASREASLEMSDAPTQNAVAGTGASLVSMFQTNSIAVKAERYINWRKRRTAAVSYLDGTHYVI